VHGGYDDEVKVTVPMIVRKVSTVRRKHNNGGGIRGHKNFE
jgi:hypothetical protein